MKKLIILAFISISITCNAQTEIEKMVTEVNAILNRPSNYTPTPIEYYYSRPQEVQVVPPIYTTPLIPNPVIIVVPNGVFNTPIYTTPIINQNLNGINTVPVFTPTQQDINRLILSYPNIKR